MTWSDDEDEPAAGNGRLATALFAAAAVVALLAAGLAGVLVFGRDLYAPAAETAASSPGTATAPEPERPAATPAPSAADSPPAAPDTAQTPPAAPPATDAAPPAGEAPPEAAATPAGPTQAPAPTTPAPPAADPAPAQAAPAAPATAAAPPVPAPPAAEPSALPPAPDPGLVEQTALGPLPRIGTDGREAWRVYARPSDPADPRPRIAVIISALGLSTAATETAIQGLPGAVTLAFQPYAEDIQRWVRLARAAGHEVMIDLPMEPLDFPVSEPGPQALFVELPPETNQTRLAWSLSRTTGYVGVLNHMGSRFTTSRDAMLPVLRTLKQRGLMFVDARTSARSVGVQVAGELGVPRAINDRFLDAGEKSRVSIDARLAEVERIAREVGASLAIGHGYPVTMERVRVWAQGLPAKGIALVPATALIGRQADR
ncbi:MAG: divergent polysaccharide deacetylase family protein [Alphaproteobacteria bacterium]